MTVQQLIEELQRLGEEHGFDLPVHYGNDARSDCDIDSFVPLDARGDRASAGKPAVEVYMFGIE